MKLYCMKDPKGNFIWQSLSQSKNDCWFEAYPFLGMSKYLGEEWHTKYWKNLTGSKKSAKDHGYKIVSVGLKEVR